MNRDEYYIALNQNKNSLAHYGISGQKWGVRRFQNEDGSLTPAGEERYNKLQSKVSRAEDKAFKLQSKLDRQSRTIGVRAAKQARKAARLRRAENNMLTPKLIKRFDGWRAGKLETRSAKKQTKIQVTQAKIDAINARINKYNTSLSKLNPDYVYAGNQKVKNLITKYGSNPYR